METGTRFHPSADQFALAAAIEPSLTKLLPLARLHKASAEDAPTLAGLEEIGVFAGSGEASGGMTVVEEALIVATLGRQLAAPGVLATVGAAPALRRAGLASGGHVVPAWRRGDHIVVVAEPEPRYLLVRDAHGAELHDVREVPLRPLDDPHWLAALGEAAAPLAAGVRLAPAEVSRLRLLDAAALAGMAEGTLTIAVAYAGQREQFGRPIGSFQAVKHHCANMVIAARSARDQVNFAAVALAEGRADAVLQVESALLVAGAAALDNAAKNIQVHGGMGFSDEAAPHLFLKRAQLLVNIAGGLEAAAARIADVPPES